MIIANQKPFEQVKEYIAGYGKILVLGCGTCVTVCQAGGEAEVQLLSSGLRIAARREGVEITVLEKTIQRQCDEEFIAPVIELINEEKIEAVLTMGCGVGVNFLAERVGAVPVYPGVNTTFYGAAIRQGVWAGLCAGCGDCIAHQTGGICPVARCSKSLINGPCGGMNRGKCEVGQDIDCAWSLIMQRMKELGGMEKLRAMREPRDWSTFGAVGLGTQRIRDVSGAGLVEVKKDKIG